MFTLGLGLVYDVQHGYSKVQGTMAIQVVVTLFGALRGGGNPTLTLELATSSTVSDALRACGLPNRVDIWTLVDGQKASLDSKLHNGAQVQFFQPVGGG